MNYLDTFVENFDRFNWGKGSYQINERCVAFKQWKWKENDNIRS
jgi:hypothetical protein